jgi:hypothetical protein
MPPFYWSGTTFPADEDGITYICVPPEVATAGGLTSTFLPGDGGPQLDTTDPTAFAIGGGAFAYQCDVDPEWFCWAGDTYHCMEPYPATLDLTAGPGMLSLAGLTGTMNLLTITGASADYAVRMVIPGTGGQEVAWRVSIGQGSPVGCDVFGTGMATGTHDIYSDSADTTPDSGLTYTRVIPFGSTTCPINLRFKHPADPSYYFTVTE